MQRMEADLRGREQALEEMRANFDGWKRQQEQSLLQRYGGWGMGGWGMGAGVWGLGYMSLCGGARCGGLGYGGLEYGG